MPQFARQPSGAAESEYVGSLPRTWQEEAVRAQALLGRASLEVGLESQGNRDLLAFQLAQAVGPNLNPPDLAAQGLRFMRAQLLSFGGEPLAQLLYLGATGAPLALYAKKGEGIRAPLFKQYGGIGSVAWSHGGIAYLLAGEGDEASLLRLADAISTEGPKAVDASPAYSPLPPSPRRKPKP
jgi:anti-sigma factor RsiW